VAGLGGWLALWAAFARGGWHPLCSLITYAQFNADDRSVPFGGFIAAAGGVADPREGGRQGPEAAENDQITEPHGSPAGASPQCTFMRLRKKGMAGFTLVEIMIVVGIIAVLSAIAVPNWVRARKRTQATIILEDLRNLDHAVDQYAIDNSKTGGVNPTFIDLRAYVKQGTILYNTGEDLFGDSYGPFTVDSTPQVPAIAYATLSDVAAPVFWSPYAVAAQ
jgi:prepilin-type N-terminal cleavage/methylation domain-containing protein